jgi:large subunit ribosomal protein L33
MVIKGGSKMAKKNENREYIDMECTECKSHIIRTQKNKKNTPDRMELNKFCPKCRKSVLFKEKK